MHSTHLVQQIDWERQMAEAAQNLPEPSPEEEVDEADIMPDQQHQEHDAYIPPEVEDAERLDSDDLAVLDTWTDLGQTQGDQEMEEEHFGSDDDTEEFRSLLYEVVEKCERSLPRESSQVSERMDTT